MKYLKELGFRLLFSLIFILFYGFYYKILFPLTVYPAYFIINLFYSVSFVGNSFVISNSIVNFIPACIAVAAYALLFLLIIFTKGIGLKKSVKIFLIGSGLILVMNVLRIDLLLIILVELGNGYFDKVHLLFWHFVSGVYVAFVWIYLVKKFRVSGVPIVF